MNDIKKAEVKAENSVSFILENNIPLDAKSVMITIGKPCEINYGIYLGNGKTKNSWYDHCGHISSSIGTKNVNNITAIPSGIEYLRIFCTKNECNSNYQPCNGYSYHYCNVIHNYCPIKNTFISNVKHLLLEPDCCKKNRNGSYGRYCDHYYDWHQRSITYIFSYCKNEIERIKHVFLLGKYFRYGKEICSYRFSNDNDANDDETIIPFAGPGYVIVNTKMYLGNDVIESDNIPHAIKLNDTSSSVQAYHGVVLLFDNIPKNVTSLKITIDKYIHHSVNAQIFNTKNNLKTQVGYALVTHANILDFVPNHITHLQIMSPINDSYDCPVNGCKSEHVFDSPIGNNTIPPSVTHLLINVEPDSSYISSVKHVFIMNHNGTITYKKNNLRYYARLSDDRELLSNETIIQFSDVNIVVKKPDYYDKPEKKEIEQIIIPS